MAAKDKPIKEKRNIRIIGERNIVKIDKTL